MGSRAAGLTAVLMLHATPAAQVKMTTQKALELAFPGCKVDRQTVTLDEKKRAAIGKLCGQKFKKSMVFPYVARRAGKIVGTAWFDVHKVRSKRQLLMVVVGPAQRVLRVEVLAFAEPRRYAAKKPWLRKLKDRKLGELQPGRGVPRITGATLTVRATTRCVERMLAVHRVVFGKPTPSPPTPKTTPRKQPGKGQPR